MIYEKAYGKINLHLQVLGKRDEDYHYIQTVFVKINLFDDIFVEFAKGRDIEVIVEGEKITREKNLAYIASKWYLKRYGIKNWGASIVIKKRIPQGSGLGGGSADAGAVLRAFYKFFKEVDDNLVKATAEIGADVPFLFSELTAAFGEGIGENLTPINLKDLDGIKILYPNISISTSEVFSKFDEMEEEIISKKKPLPKEKIINIAEEGNIESFKKYFFNHLEEPCFRLRPEIGILKSEIEKKSDGFVIMTGSGSSIVLIGDTNNICSEVTIFETTLLR